MEEAKVEQIAMVMRRRRLEWFRHMETREETINIRAVAKMKMVRKILKGIPRLRWRDSCQTGHESQEVQEGMGH